jgi:alpha-glucosidase (family GH31 glycosyl hydrolase)
MYTQMYSSLQDDSLNTGLPLVRPLMMEFPDDVRLNNNHIIWKQFMFGEAIMVTPIIDPGI